MAALSAGDRAALDRLAQRQLTRDAGGGFGALSAADLRAAIAAIDDWADTNTASFNTAIPVAARNALSARQKSWLLMYVIAKRAAVA